MALRQDDGLLQAAHDDPPQLLQHTLQHSLFTHGGEQRQSVKQTTNVTKNTMNWFMLTHQIQPYRAQRAAVKVYSLSIQEVHERPQHVVGVGLHLVLRVGIERSFDLVQQRRHLTHALSDAALKAAEKHDECQSFNCKCTVCVGGCVYLFPNVLLSSSSTLFSFTCRSFSKSLASVSICTQTAHTHNIEITTRKLSSDQHHKDETPNPWRESDKHRMRGHGGPRYTQASSAEACR